MQRSPFHLAIQVRDILEARDFYGELMDFPEGRSDTHRVDTARLCRYQRAVVRDRVTSVCLKPAAFEAGTN